jgi:hypothetical protein
MMAFQYSKLTDKQKILFRAAVLAGLVAIYVAWEQWQSYKSQFESGPQMYTEDYVKILSHKIDGPLIVIEIQNKTKEWYESFDVDFLTWKKLQYESDGKTVTRTCEESSKPLTGKRFRVESKDTLDPLAVRSYSANLGTLLDQRQECVAFKIAAATGFAKRK